MEENELKEILIDEKILKEDLGEGDFIEDDSHINVEGTEKDTSFEKYLEEERLKEKIQKQGVMKKTKSFIGKIFKVVVGIPVGIMTAIFVVGVLGTTLGMGIAGIAGGVMTLAAAAFIGFDGTSLLGWLGIFVTIGIWSASGLVFILFIYLVKKAKSVLAMVKGERA